MFIRRVVLTNFRAYQGEISVDFPDPTPGHNVYLLGGDNGAGKTSILFALSLGLYGVNADGLAFRSGRRDRNRAYSSCLEDSVNRSAASSGQDFMSVGIWFEAHGSSIEISRQWWFEQNRFVEEDVQIRIDGMPIDPGEADVATLSGRQEVAVQLTDAVLPSRAARFFIFDGEEVASLAERDLGRSVIKGLDDLLGLDGVQKLISELTMIEKEARQALKRSAVSLDLEVVHAELGAAETDSREAFVRVEEAQATVHSLEGKLAAINESLGAIFQGREASTPLGLKVELSRRLEELTAVSRSISGLISEHVSIMPTPGLMARLRRETERSIKYKRDVEVANAVGDALEGAAASILKTRTSPSLTSEQKTVIRNRIIAQAEVVRSGLLKKQSPLVDLSLTELERLRVKASALDSVRHGDDTRVWVAKRRQLKRIIKALESDLRQFETSGVAEDLIERRTDTAAMLDWTRAECAAAASLAVTANARVQEVNARLALMEELLSESNKSAAHSRVARRSRLALEQFIRSMRIGRTERVQHEAAAMLRGLLHRKGSLATIDIDADAFNLTLLDEAGHEIPLPSAGERELLALSLIYGLGKLSGREAPLVIDTPLGRLDNEHRSAIVTKFLPAAASQVIVLATDAEISGGLYRDLRPFLAWQGMIVHESERGAVVCPGQYFTELELS